MGEAIQNSTQVDVVYDYTVQNINKMSLIVTQLDQHYDVINDSVKHLDFLKGQLEQFEKITEAN